MTLGDYGSLAEIIGVVGMIASLIYVGYQLQQARVQMKGAASQARADSQMNLWLTSTNSDFAEMQNKVMFTSETLTGTDLIQQNGFMVSWLGFLQNTFYQRKLGLLDEDQVGFLNTLPAFRIGHIRQYWEQVRFSGAYPADFVSHIDSVLTKQDNERADK